MEDAVKRSDVPSTCTHKRKRKKRRKRGALNSTVHSSMDMTPFKLWMAGAEDLVFPSDLIFDTPQKLAMLCPNEYLSEQKAEM